MSLLHGIGDAAYWEPYTLDGKPYLISTQVRGGIYTVWLHHKNKPRSSDAIAFVRGSSLLDGSPAENRVYLDDLLRESLAAKELRARAVQ